MSRIVLPTVPGKYGAPMGRASYVRETQTGWPIKCRLQRIALDSGGYDTGGAYCGLGLPIYCAQTHDDSFFATVRAHSRREAAMIIREEFGLDFKFHGIN